MQQNCPISFSSTITIFLTFERRNVLATLLQIKQCYIDFVIFQIYELIGIQILIEIFF